MIVSTRLIRLVRQSPVSQAPSQCCCRDVADPNPVHRRRAGAGRGWRAAMRLSELARPRGVSIPSIKFYLRGGLLPAGEALSKTQADYNQAHVDRLRLIRALRE